MRYKQSLIGIGWAVFQPLAAVSLVTYGFRNHDIGGDIPYPLFAAIGFMFWFFFSNSLLKVSSSIVVNSGIITKVYFPRAIIPISGIFVQVADFFAGSLVVAGLLFYYGIGVTWEGVLAYILMLIVLCVSCIGIGLVTSALNARYRDVQFFLPFLIQVMIFVSPVIYPLDHVVGSAWQYLNPLVSTIDIARTGLLNPEAISWMHAGLALLVSLAYFAVGLLFFLKADKNITDEI